MNDFLSTISPSLKFKVLESIYRKALQNMPIFQNRPTAVETLMHKINFVFIEPEQILIEQNDPDNDSNDVYFTSSGRCQINRKLNTFKTFTLGYTNEGEMLGTKSALFESRSKV